jgi:hypothetical protein
VNFEKFFGFGHTDGAFGLLFAEGFKFPNDSASSIIVIVLTFALISMLETMKTAAGCCKNA